MDTQYFALIFQNKKESTRWVRDCSQLTKNVIVCHVLRTVCSSFNGIHMNLIFSLTCTKHGYSTARLRPNKSPNTVARKMCTMDPRNVLHHHGNSFLWICAAEIDGVKVTFCSTFPVLSRLGFKALLPVYQHKKNKWRNKDFVWTRMVFWSV